MIRILGPDSEAGAGRGRPGQARAGQGRPGQARGGRDRPGQAGAGRVRPGQAGSGQKGPAEAFQGLPGPFLGRFLVRKSKFRCRKTWIWVLIRSPWLRLASEHAQNDPPASPGPLGRALGVENIRLLAPFPGLSWLGTAALTGSVWGTFSRLPCRPCP